MPWFKVDDGFDSHPKVLDVPLRAIGLWTKAGAWSARNLTDGEVPSSAVRVLGGTKNDADRLAAAGLWDVVKDERGTVYRFHDWEEFNPTSSQVKEQRRKTAERVASWRERKRNGVTTPMGNSVTEVGSNAVSNAAPDPTRPDPVLPTEVPRALARSGESQPDEKREPRKAPSVRLPAEWRPGDGHHAIAHERGVDLELELANFRDHAKANDRRAVDWDAAFRTWLRRSTPTRQPRPADRPRPELVNVTKLRLEQQAAGGAQ